MWTNYHTFKFLVLFGHWSMDNRIVCQGQESIRLIGTIKTCNITSVMLQGHDNL